MSTLQHLPWITVAAGSCCFPPRPPITEIPTGTFDVSTDAILEELGTDAMTVTVTDSTVEIRYENAEGSHEIIYDRSPLPQWYGD